MTQTQKQHESTPKPIDVTAAEATLYIPTPLHPRSEALADKLFKRVLRPGIDGPREECIRQADAACASCLFPCSPSLSQQAEAGSR